MPFTHRSARPNGASLRALRDPDAASSRSRPPVPRMAVRIGEIRRSKAVRPQRCIYMLYALQDVAMAAGVGVEMTTARSASARSINSANRELLIETRDLTDRKSCVQGFRSDLARGVGHGLRKAV